MSAAPDLVVNDVEIAPVGVPAPRHAPVDLILFAVIQATVVGLPLFYSLDGFDSFRTTKTLLLRATAIIILAAALSAEGELRRIFVRSLTRSEKFFILAILGWAAVSSLGADHRFVALNTIVNMCAAALFYCGVRYSFATRGFLALDLFMLPALMNGALYLAEEFRDMDPFGMAAAGHPAHGAFLGNSTDVGSYLVPAALAAMAAWHASKGWRSAIYAVLSLALTVTTVWTQTLTAFIAVVVGIALLVLIAVPKRAFIALPVVMAVLAYAAVSYAPLRTRYHESMAESKRGEYNIILAGRMPAFLAAWEMFRDHPIQGVGPGAFGVHYFDYRLRADQKYPKASHWSPVLGTQENFGEAHNDHLQILAEFGLVGYLLFLGALGALASITLRRLTRKAATAREEFARVLAAPLAVAIAVLALAQFPLQLASAGTAILFTIALCHAWSHPAEQTSGHSVHTV